MTRRRALLPDGRVTVPCEVSADGWWLPAASCAVLPHSAQLTRTTLGPELVTETVLVSQADSPVRGVLPAGDQAKTRLHGDPIPALVRLLAYSVPHSLQVFPPRELLQYVVSLQIPLAGSASRSHARDKGSVHLLPRG